MAVEGGKRGAFSRVMQAGALAGFLALAGSGCVSPGQPQQPASSLPPTTSLSNAPSPSLPPAPSPSTLPLPGTTVPSGVTTTLRGTVTEGVESGCVVLVDDSGAVAANLLDWDLRTHPFDSQVEVTGMFRADLMTTCQQGTPFDVRTAVGR